MSETVMVEPSNTPGNGTKDCNSPIARYSTIKQCFNIAFKAYDEEAKARGEGEPFNEKAVGIEALKDDRADSYYLNIVDKGNGQWDKLKEAVYSALDAAEVEYNIASIPNAAGISIVVNKFQPEFYERMRAMALNAITKIAAHDPNHAHWAESAFSDWYKEDLNLPERLHFPERAVDNTDGWVRGKGKGESEE